MNHIYLARTTQITSQEPRSMGPDLFVQETVEETDPATSHPQEHSLIITLEHHIVYSPTYQVPVLYFDAYFLGKKFVVVTRAVMNCVFRWSTIDVGRSVLTRCACRLPPRSFAWVEPRHDYSSRPSFARPALLVCPSL